ncbi:hypothetical protein DFJ74DRAFT_531597 [Hyaloraphidium curvatum]|nr:hypothetical protein DFJ74DRAFT_531597 [Hyaloraphidium curvatum]
MATPSIEDISKHFKGEFVLPLAGKRAVVTGANRGVGRIAALLLALHGVHVALADIAPPDETRRECEEIVRRAKETGIGVAGGPRLFASVPFDAGQAGSSRAMIEEAERQLGGNGLDHLFLVHTLPEYSAMLDPQTDLLGRARKHAEVNYLGYVEAATAALPFLRKNADVRVEETLKPRPTLFGRIRGYLARGPLSPYHPGFYDLIARSGITVVSSLSARIPFEFTHGYAASKAAIESWFGCLGLELSAAGVPVSVSVVTFAAVRTQVLVDALTRTGQRRALEMAADPTEAALAMIRAGITGVADAPFPSSTGFVRILYAVAPAFTRWMIAAIEGPRAGGPGTKAVGWKGKGE